MNRQDACEALDGKEYPLRLEDAFEDILKESGLVVVYGDSDDLVEFRGAIYDEIDAYEGGTAYLNNNGMLENDCEEGDCCPHFVEIRKQAKIIKALWCKEKDISWTYKTDIPHDTFEIKEDDEIYCRGIVFKLSDV